MPEVVEIKISTEQLNKLFTAERRVIEFKFLSTGRYKTKKPIGHEKFQQLLQTHSKGLVVRANCHGKLQWLEFFDDTQWLAAALVTHGMTGHWITVPTTLHISAVMCFANSEKVFFEDIRRFGTFKFIFTQQALADKKATLGLDILTADIEHIIDVVVDSCCGTKNVTEFLMSQKWLAGVGNYIKAEALYEAKISPHRSMVSLSKLEAETLARAVVKVAQASYEQQGLYFKNHQLIDGNAGSFAKQLAVYRKKLDPLGNVVISEDTFDKRTTWWVPDVQK